MPKKFFTAGGLTRDEYLLRFSSIGEDGNFEENHFFQGIWQYDSPDNKNLEFLEIDLSANKSSVHGEVSFSKNNDEKFILEHICLVSDSLNFTFKNQKNSFFEVKGFIQEDTIHVHLYGIENDYGVFRLQRKK